MRATIARVKERAAPLESPYLRGLRTGSMSREEFLASQGQFFFAVAYFKEPMRALAARVPEPIAETLLANVRDEEGGGDASQSHESTFLDLLSRLGADTSRQGSPCPAVRAFNAALFGTCAAADPYLALAMLGMIEDLFAPISLDLGRAIVARGWLPQSRLVHYPAHALLDLAHAEGFYRHVEPAWPDRRDAIVAGLELGAHVFLRLYEGLQRFGEQTAAHRGF
jgi:pyrroloquinoline-quinone synthase